MLGQHWPIKMLPHPNLTEFLHFIKIKYYYHGGPWLVSLILEKKSKPGPPCPQIKDGKMARFGFCTASPLIWRGRRDGGFTVPFYSVQDCSSLTHKYSKREQEKSPHVQNHDSGWCLDIGTNTLCILCSKNYLNWWAIVCWLDNQLSSPKAVL